MRARRLPNAWFLVPLLIAGVVGAVTGRAVARVSCVVGDGPGGSGCVATEVVAAVLGALVAMAGVAVVVALALMSIAEWRRAQEKGEGPPRPGCEAEPADAQDQQPTEP